MKITLWDRRFEEMSNYQQIHGHCCISATHKNVRLRNWAMRMRQMFHIGELTDCKTKKLESIGFMWNVDMIDILNYKGSSKLKLKSIKQTINALVMYGVHTKKG